MSEEEQPPVPVSGSLTRKRPDGTNETIEMTVEEVQTAPDRFNEYDCQNIIVTYDDGSRQRPYRFIDTAAHFRTTVDPETGETIGTF